MGRVDGNGGGNRLIRKGNVLFGANEEISLWLSRRIAGYQIQPGAKCLAVIKGDRIAAAVAFERFNGKHVEASIAADINCRWADRKTLATLFAYPFLQLQARAITVLCASSNLPSINLAVKLGFEAKALVPFAAHDGTPLVVLQMYPETCRWLNHGKKQSTPAA